MENLHRAIEHQFDDFIQPKARGSALEGIPVLWEEEAQLDNKIFEERLRQRLSPDWHEPYVLRAEKKEEPKQNEGFDIDEKRLARILMEFDESLVLRLKAKRYNIQDTRPEVYALVALADENGWQMGEYIYRIK